MARVFLVTCLTALPSGVLTHVPEVGGLESCLNDEASLLSIGRSTVMNSNSAVVGSLHSCEEALFEGLCYRTCESMGAPGPRLTASNCGYLEDPKFMQSCTKDGEGYPCSGNAPGTRGRPEGKCFEADGGSESEHTQSDFAKWHKKDHGKAEGDNSKAVSMCRQISDKMWHLSSAWVCSDGAEPKVKLHGLKLKCSCPLSNKNGPPRLKPPRSILETSLLKPCNTGCIGAGIDFDGVTFCCPGGQAPKRVYKKVAFAGDYKVKCTCD